MGFFISKTTGHLVYTIMAMRLLGKDSFPLCSSNNWLMNLNWHQIALKVQPMITWLL